MLLRRSKIPEGSIHDIMLVVIGLPERGALGKSSMESNSCRNRKRADSSRIAGQAVHGLETAPGRLKWKQDRIPW